jgi:hypothetical protein
MQDGAQGGDVYAVMLQDCPTVEEVWPLRPIMLLYSSVIKFALDVHLAAKKGN